MFMTVRQLEALLSLHPRKDDLIEIANNHYTATGDYVGAHITREILRTEGNVNVFRIVVRDA